MARKRYKPGRVALAENVESDPELPSLWSILLLRTTQILNSLMW
jgi:hypothetical protein